MTEPLPRWYVALLWVTVTLFAALAWIGSASLAPADGFTSFDARVLGYDLDYARSYLTLLRAEPGAIDTYLGRVRALDTAFPALLTAALLILFRHRMQGLGQMGLGVLALIYLGADYVENWRVAGMLRTDPGLLDAATVATASAATMVKFAALAPCLIMAAWVYLRGRIAAAEDLT